MPLTTDQTRDTGAKAMTTATMPKKINPGWLKQQRTKLDCTAKTVDGEPNPNYVALATEIGQAEAELDRWREFEEWVKRHLSMILNAYPLRVNGQTFEPNQVFFSKDKATGRVQVLTRSEAWNKFVEAH